LERIIDRQESDRLKLSNSSEAQKVLHSITERQAADKKKDKKKKKSYEKSYNKTYDYSHMKNSYFTQVALSNLFSSRNNA